ncbi:trp operon leader peptide [Enterobacter quasiroggenkampii]
MTANFTLHGWWRTS